MKKILTIIFVISFLVITFETKAEENFIGKDGKQHSCLEADFIPSTVDECNKYRKPCFNGGAFLLLFFAFHFILLI